MKVKKSWILLFAIPLVASPALAQAPASTQAQASSSTSAAAKAGKADAKANANASAAASAKGTAAQGQQENKEKGTKASAKGSANASSQNSAKASAGDASLDLASGTTLEAALTKSLDVKKNKVGDEVVAKVTRDVKSDGKVVLRKGSKLIGHVTEAKARGKGESESALGIVFDRAVMKDGREIPVHLAIQAVSVSEAAAAIAASNDEVMGSAGAVSSMSGSAAGSAHPASSGGGVLGGVGSTVSGATSTVGSVAGTAGNTVGGTVNSTTGVAGSGSAGGLNALGNLTSQSAGVFGLQGLRLNSDATQATDGSLLVSSTRNVHLDSGTRMLLRAMGSAEAKPKQ
ncbi:MAG: hypothetical protein M1453_03305 [Acidobacteria bacterium]|nr:hypothetical protein [Acidobacteriota bacterium]MCL5287007.1 hypothetical protein [Acidobacteriota bacterium]